ncbi:hypothetical protein AD998_01760 [bacterium 336/3]|nr:hypothetical protein AD998_01760 [bacterium 336/3]
MQSKENKSTFQNVGAPTIVVEQKPIAPREVIFCKEETIQMKFTFPEQVLDIARNIAIKHSIPLQKLFTEAVWFFLSQQEEERDSYLKQE